MLNEHSKIGHVILNVRAHYLVKKLKKKLYAERGKMYLAVTLSNYHRFLIIFALL